MSIASLTTCGRAVRARQAARCRGSVYVAVLGASMIVVLLGVSGLLAVRVQRQAMQMTHESSQAQLLARSAIELALLRLADDPNWRTSYTADTWTADRTLGRGVIRFKLVNERGGALDDDSTGRVWLHGQAQLGDTLRTTRVLLEPAASRAGANLLRDADMDAGTRAWFLRSGDGELRYTREDSRQGHGALWMRGRTEKWTGPRQTITDQVENGEAYRLEAWVHALDVADTFTLQITTLISGNNPSTENRHGSTSHLVAADGNWAHLTATVTPTWSGTLGEATWRVVTVNQTGDFLIDAVRLVRERDLHTMLPVPGTWEQVVGP